MVNLITLMKLSLTTLIKWQHSGKALIRGISNRRISWYNRIANVVKWDDVVEERSSFKWSEVGIAWEVKKFSRILNLIQDTYMVKTLLSKLYIKLSIDSCCQNRPVKKIRLKCVATDRHTDKASVYRLATLRRGEKTRISMFLRAFWVPEIQ